MPRPRVADRRLDTLPQHEWLGLSISASERYLIIFLVFYIQQRYVVLFTVIVSTVVKSLF